MSSWRFNHLRDSAEVVHARELPAERAIWQASISESAVVLGSKQNLDIVNQSSCQQDGISVVHRRSGGGVVVLQAGAHLWIDFVVPRDDELWRDDVGESMWWVGELWADALAVCEVADRDQLRVHRGGLERSSLSDLVCFGGLGPGEVTMHGQKVVGISQRRTREMARFQCVLHQKWSPDLYHRYLLTDKIKMRAGEQNTSLEFDFSRIAVAPVTGLSQVAEAIVELAAKI
jgi:lipoate-protein ligase A